MHVDPDRFALTDREQARLKQFREYIWENPELCNECFTRIRSIGEHHTKFLEYSDVEHRPAAESPLRVDVAGHHERTPAAEHGYPPTRTPASDRFGTTFCGECGADGRLADPVSLDELAEDAANILRYTVVETPLDVAGGVMGREISHLKTHESGRYDGRDAQVLAVAWVRALQTGREPRADAEYTVTTD